MFARRCGTCWLSCAAFLQTQQEPSLLLLHQARGFTIANSAATAISGDDETVEAAAEVLNGEGEEGAGGNASQTEAKPLEEDVAETGSNSDGENESRSDHDDDDEHEGVFHAIPGTTNRELLSFITKHLTESEVFTGGLRDSILNNAVFRKQFIECLKKRVVNVLESGTVFVKATQEKLLPHVLDKLLSDHLGNWKADVRAELAENEEFQTGVYKRLMDVDAGGGAASSTSGGAGGGGKEPLKVGTSETESAEDIPLQNVDTGTVLFLQLGLERAGSSFLSKRQMPISQDPTPVLDITAVATPAGGGRAGSAPAPASTVVEKSRAAASSQGSVDLPLEGDYRVKSEESIAPEPKEPKPTPPVPAKNVGATIPEVFRNGVKAELLQGSTLVDILEASDNIMETLGHSLVQDAATREALMQELEEKEILWQRILDGKGVTGNAAKEALKTKCADDLLVDPHFIGKLAEDLVQAEDRVLETTLLLQEKRSGLGGGAPISFLQAEAAASSSSVTSRIGSEVDNKNLLQRFQSVVDRDVVVLDLLRRMEGALLSRITGSTAGEQVGDGQQQDTETNRDRSKVVEKIAEDVLAGQNDVRMRKVKTDVVDSESASLSAGEREESRGDEEQGAAESSVEDEEEDQVQAGGEEVETATEQDAAPAPVEEQKEDEQYISSDKNVVDRQQEVPKTASDAGAALKEKYEEKVAEAEAEERADDATDEEQETVAAGAGETTAEVDGDVDVDDAAGEVPTGDGNAPAAETSAAMSHQIQNQDEAPELGTQATTTEGSPVSEGASSTTGNSQANGMNVETQKPQGASASGSSVAEQEQEQANESSSEANGAVQNQTPSRSRKLGAVPVAHRAQDDGSSVETEASDNAEVGALARPEPPPEEEQTDAEAQQHARKQEQEDAAEEGQGEAEVAAGAAATSAETQSETRYSRDFDAEAQVGEREREAVAAATPEVAAEEQTSAQGHDGHGATEETIMSTPVESEKALETGEGEPAAAPEPETTAADEEQPAQEGAAVAAEETIATPTATEESENAVEVESVEAPTPEQERVQVAGEDQQPAQEDGAMETGAKATESEKATEAQAAAPARTSEAAAEEQQPAPQENAAEETVGEKASESEMVAEAEAVAAPAPVEEGQAAAEGRQPAQEDVAEKTVAEGNESERAAETAEAAAAPTPVEDGQAAAEERQPAPQEDAAEETVVEGNDSERAAETAEAAAAPTPVEDGQAASEERQPAQEDAAEETVAEGNDSERAAEPAEAAAAPTPVEDGQAAAEERQPAQGDAAEETVAEGIDSERAAETAEAAAAPSPVEDGQAAAEERQSAQEDAAEETVAEGNEPERAAETAEAAVAPTPDQEDHGQAAAEPPTEEETAVETNEASSETSETEQSEEIATAEPAARSADKEPMAETGSEGKSKPSGDTAPAEAIVASETETETNQQSQAAADEMGAAAASAETTSTADEAEGAAKQEDVEQENSDVPSEPQSGDEIIGGDTIAEAAEKASKIAAKKEGELFSDRIAKSLEKDRRLLEAITGEETTMKKVACTLARHIAKVRIAPAYVELLAGELALKKPLIAESAARVLENFNTHDVVAMLNDPKECGEGSRKTYSCRLQTIVARVIAYAKESDMTENSGSAPPPEPAAQPKPNTFDYAGTEQNVGTSGARLVHQKAKRIPRAASRTKSKRIMKAHSSSSRRMLQFDVRLK